MRRVDDGAVKECLELIRGGLELEVAVRECLGDPPDALWSPDRATWIARSNLLAKECDRHLTSSKGDRVTKEGEND